MADPIDPVLRDSSPGISLQERSIVDSMTRTRVERADFAWLEPRGDGTVLAEVLPGR